MERTLLEGGVMRPSTLLFFASALVAVCATAACGGKAFNDEGSPLPGSTTSPGSDTAKTDASIEPARTKASFCLTAERSSLEIEMFQLLTPTPPADYLALRRLSGGFEEPDGGREIIVDAERGVKCEHATDRAACEKRYKNIEFNEIIFSHLFYTRGDEVVKVDSPAKAVKLIGVVDSPEDAFFVARQAGFAATCQGEASAEYRQIDDSYELVTEQGGCNSDVMRVVVRVNRDGSVEEVSRTKIDDSRPCM